MAIINSIQRIMNGFGNGTAYVVGNGVALSTTSLVATTVTLATYNANYTQGYTCGKGRVKIYNGGTTPTALISVSVSDGTNTVTIFVMGSATAIGATAAGGVDFTFEFNVDIQISSITVNTTLGGTTPTASMDYEFDLQP